MPPLDPSQADALSKPSVMMLHALQWDLPGRDPLRFSELHAFAFLVDGASATFKESDTTFGTLGPLSQIEDGMTGDAPTLSFTIYPPSNAAIAILTDPAVQGSRLRVWVPVLDPATGIVIGTPQKWFDGWSDAATNLIDENSHSLAVEAKSKLIRVIMPQEGARLSNGWHQTHHPGELGMQYTSAIQRQVPWGSSTPASPLDKSQVQFSIGDLSGSFD